MKICPKCNQERELNFFFNSSGRSDGKAGLCKDCYYLCKKKYDQTPSGRYVMIKKGAKRRGYSFLLTMDEFMKYWNQKCFYCSDAIEGIGIDRVNNSVGYEVGNIVSCCKTCNMMKLVSSSDSFIDQCRKISETHEIS